MPSKKSKLARNTGFLEAMTLGGGTMIGAGIFILPGIAAANSGPARSLAFALAGVVALLATGIVFITFLGFEIIATVAGEIKNLGDTLLILNKKHVRI